MAAKQGTERKSRMNARRLRILLWALLCGAGAPVAHAYSTAVALVVETSGTTDPSLSIHREVAPGTRITLSAGARVTLLHYASCAMVTLKGGTATITGNGVETDTANVESTKPGPCPRLHKIVREGPRPAGGAVVTRGLPSPPLAVSPDAVLMIVGNGAADAVSVEPLDDARKSAAGARIPIRNQSFKLDGTLTPAHTYVLRIVFAGKGDLVELPISISPSAAKGILVLQLD